MILSMADQARFFLWTMILGAVSGMAYDIFRITRRVVKHPDFLTQIEDLFYWLFVSVLFFYFILHHNSGEVRIYAIIGIFSGMCLYFLTLSRLLVKASVFLIGVIEKIILTAIHMLLMPLRFTIKLLSYPANAFKRWSVKRYNSGKSLMRRSSKVAGFKMARLKNDMYIIRKKI
jgi:spore cortex biosynthesis protein YabQ